MTEADTGPTLLLDESTPKGPVAGCCGSRELAATLESTATAPAAAIHTTQDEAMHHLAIDPIAVSRPCCWITIG
jgi:hypothetical protein